LRPKRIRVVSNGIPDPCPEFATQILPRRRARALARAKLVAAQELTPAELLDCEGDPRVFHILYLAHCTREKGLFDTIEGVRRANQILAARKSPLSLHLTVAGNFVDEDERSEFNRLQAIPENQKNIRYLGFVAGPQKKTALREADLFCFPTYYQNENQPVNLIEAMAFSLPILTTRWRSIPELFPPDYPCLVDVRSPGQIAEALTASLARESAEAFREIFLRQFNLEQHLAAMAAAILSLEQNDATAAPSPAPQEK
jgi:glycosyltransferase involved in cell wall biosynthesis